MQCHTYVMTMYKCVRKPDMPTNAYSVVSGGTYRPTCQNRQCSAPSCDKTDARCEICVVTDEVLVGASTPQ